MEYCPAVPSGFSLLAPIRTAISITGSFGELRNNHFHAGIDIRSLRGTGGDDILAAAAGFVKKIKIEANNYGKSLFVEHEGGFTTMYAHLNHFAPDIEARVKMQQYKEQKFEIELEFTPDEFPVWAGQQIAYMGNTGASRGPHLHFELRKTGTKEVLDPVEYGLPIHDELEPLIRKIKVYGFDLDGNSTSEKMYPKSLLANNYNILAVPGDIFSVGVDAMDRSNNSWNWTGVKSIQLFIDGGLFYHYSSDSWSLDDGKYINAHIDYKSKLAAQGSFHRCHILSGNKIPLYRSVKNDGLFYIGDGIEHDVQIIVADASGNTSQLHFGVKATSFLPVNISNTQRDNIKCNTDNIFECTSASFVFPSGCFYQDNYARIDSLKNNYALAFSDWFGVNLKSVPIHDYFTIKILPGKPISEHLKAKCFIAKKRNQSYISTGGKWSGQFLTSEFNELGLYSIMVDTIAPTITPVLYKKRIAPKGKLIYRIQDNIPSLGRSQSIQYNAYIDGQWILMEHDAKTKVIQHTFEDWLGKGTHELLIVATDDRGNTREYRNSFIR